MRDETMAFLLGGFIILLIFIGIAGFVVLYYGGMIYIGLKLLECIKAYLTQG